MKVSFVNTVIFITSAFAASDDEEGWGKKFLKKNPCIKKKQNPKQLDDRQTRLYEGHNQHRQKLYIYGMACTCMHVCICTCVLHLGPIMRKSCKYIMVAIILQFFFLRFYATSCMEYLVLKIQCKSSLC